MINILTNKRVVNSIVFKKYCKGAKCRGGGGVQQITQYTQNSKPFSAKYTNWHSQQGVILSSEICNTYHYRVSRKTSSMEYEFLFYPKLIGNMEFIVKIKELCILHRNTQRGYSV